MPSQAEEVGGKHKLAAIFRNFRRDGKLPHLTDADLAEAFEEERDDDSGGENKGAAKETGNKKEPIMEGVSGRTGQAQVDTADVTRKITEFCTMRSSEKETRLVEWTTVVTIDTRERLKIMGHDFIFFHAWPAQRRRK
jgi:hypothetical protein